MKEVLSVFQMIADVGSEPFGAYVISMATDASDVLAVRLLQKEAGPNPKPETRNPKPKPSHL